MRLEFYRTVEGETSMCMFLALTTEFPVGFLANVGMLGMAFLGMFFQAWVIISDR
jgi:hypothetical protein